MDKFSGSTSSDLTLDSVQIANATRGASGEQIDEGWGVFGEQGTGTRSLHVVDAVFLNNGLGGGGGGGAIDFIGTLDIRGTTLNGNYLGAIVSGPTTVDRSAFVANLAYGLFVGGDFSITNSFIVRNQLGLAINGAPTTPVFAFNTVADNTVAGVNCDFSTQFAPVTSLDNIIVGNNPNTSGTGDCTFQDSIVTSNRSSLHFVGPDSAPFNYRLGAGSIAIDAAKTSVVDHDCDGESRPKGSGRDVGADEAF